MSELNLTKAVPYDSKDTERIFFHTWKILAENY